MSDMPHDPYPSRGHRERLIEGRDRIAYSAALNREHALDQVQLEANEREGFVVIPEVFAAAGFRPEFLGRRGYAPLQPLENRFA